MKLLSVYSGHHGNQIWIISIEFYVLINASELCWMKIIEYEDDNNKSIIQCMKNGFSTEYVDIYQNINR